MSEGIAYRWVSGKPIPQGSMNFYGQGRVAHKPTLTAWRDTVNQHVQQFTQQYGDAWEPIDRPVEVRADFFLPKARGNRDLFPVDSKKPDVDKAARAILDSISLEKYGPGRLLADDRLVVNLWATKRYATGMPGEYGHEPGARVRVKLHE